MHKKLNYKKIYIHPIYKNFEILTIGYWNSLKQKDKNIIYEIATLLVEESFGQLKTNPNFKEDIINMLSNGILIIIRNIKSKEVATLAKYKIINRNENNILILQLAISSLKHNTIPLYTTYIKTLISFYKINYICLRSQNPKTYTIIKKYSSNIYPSLDNKQIPEFIKKIAKNILNDIGNNDFNLNTFVDRGTFSENVYQNGINYVSSDEKVNLLFDSRLNYSRGDSLFIIGEINETK